MRDAGYRLVKLRVPDTRTFEFRANIARQMAVLRERVSTPAEIEFDRDWDALTNWGDIEPAEVRGDA